MTVPTCPDSDMPNMGSRLKDLNAALQPKEQAAEIARLREENERLWQAVGLATTAVRLATMSLLGSSKQR